MIFDKNIIYFFTVNFCIVAYKLLQSVLKVIYFFISKYLRKGTHIVQLSFSEFRIFFKCKFLSLHQFIRLRDLL